MDGWWQVIMAGAALGVAFAAPVGPVTVAQVQAGLRAGFWLAFLVALGSLVGDGLYAVVAMVGLASAVQVPALRLALGLLGALVLAYLGWSSIREGLSARAPSRWRAATSPRQALSRRGATAAFFTGLTVSVSNPMAAAWLLSVGGAWMGSRAAGAEPGVLVVFLTGFLAGSMLWGVWLAGLVHWGRRYATPGLFRAVSVLAGLALLGFAVYLGIRGLTPGT